MFDISRYKIIRRCIYAVRQANTVFMYGLTRATKQVKHQ